MLKTQMSAAYAWLQATSAPDGQRKAHRRPFVCGAGCSGYQRSRIGTNMYQKWVAYGCFILIFM